MKTSELTGAALDWAVAKCEGVINGDALDLGFILEGGYTPSTDWALAGAIIEREKISLWSRGAEWAAESFTPNELGQEETGGTPLIAAMRCYVASKMGDDVTVPEELQGETA
jgi:hypothetical protein